MKHKFLTNVGLLILLNLLVKPFWVLGIDLKVQNTVGASEYGFYFAILNFSFLFNILLDVGMTNYNSRSVARDKNFISEQFFQMVVLRFLLGIIYMLVSFVMGKLAGYDARQMHLLIILGINQFLVAGILFLRSNISGMFLFRTDSFLSVVDRLIMILICSALLWGGIVHTSFKIEWFVYAQSAAYLLTLAAALSIVLKHSNPIQWHPGPLFNRSVLKKSTPFALLILLMTFYNRFDAVLLERLLPDPSGKEQAGIFASAFRLLDAVSMVGYLLSVFLLPVFSRLLNEKQNIKEILKPVFSLLMILSLLVVVCSVAYSDQLMAMLYNDHAIESSEVFRVLIIGFVPISVTYIFGTLLTANGNFKPLIITASAGMIINIALNILLIPAHKAVGSAYASLVAQGITAICQVIISSGYFRLTVRSVYMVKMGVFCIILPNLTLLLKILGVNMFISLVLLGISSLITAFRLGLLDFGDLKSLMFIQSNEKR